jgi:hypothetical protein
MKLEILCMGRSICWTCFEQRVLWKIFEFQSDNVRGDSIVSFMICTPHQIFLDDEIKKSESGEACSICGGEESCIQVWCGSLKKETLWKT